MAKDELVPAGEIDLEMLHELHLKHPGATVDNEVVEPSTQQLYSYRGMYTRCWIKIHFPLTSVDLVSLVSRGPEGFVQYLSCSYDCTDISEAVGASLIFFKWSSFLMLLSPGIITVATAISCCLSTTMLHWLAAIIYYPGSLRPTWASFPTTYISFLQLPFHPWRRCSYTRHRSEHLFFWWSD